MKKFIGCLMVAMIALSACDRNNNPEPNPEPQKPDKPVVPNETPQQTTLTAEEIALYYNWDKTMTVEGVDALVKSGHEAKKVGSKTIEIKEAILADRDDTKGAFTLDIRNALIDGKSHTQKLSFMGFVARPTDYEIGHRAYATWKITGAELFNNFDFDPLYISNNTEMYDVKYLSRFVTFVSSNLQGQQYTLTEEDLQQVKIIDLRYDSTGKHITFKIKYKGVTSSSHATLSLNPMEYYDHKVGIDESYVHQKYMRGVFAHLDLYNGYILSYDLNKYAAELVSNQRQNDDNNNSLSFTISLRDKKTDKELTTLTRQVRGFKPLTELKKDLVIAPSATLIETLKDKLKGDLTEGKDVTLKLKGSIMTWIKHAQFIYQNEVMDHVKKGVNEVITSESETTLNNGDLYLENPKFELVSAVIQDTKLRVTVRLAFTNEVALKGVTFDFVAHGFH